MAASIFGTALPLNFNNLQKGQIVRAAPAIDQQYIGVVAKFGHDFILVTLLATDGKTPGPLDLSACVNHIWSIPGMLEIEPEGVPFSAGLSEAPHSTLMVDSVGGIFARFLHRNDIGQQERFLIDLNTGEHSRGQGEMKPIGPVKFFIRQQGRKERFELLTLAPDRVKAE